MAKEKVISPLQRSLNVWAVILIVWSFYRFKFRLPEWFDELVAKPLVFVLPIYYYITHFEKKKFLEAIWFDRQKVLSDIIFAFGIGALFVIVALLANFVRRGDFVLGTGLLSSLPANIGLVVILSLATGISEEIVSRGFLLKRLYEDSKNIYIASLNGSILFFVLHIPILFTNPKLTGNVLLVFMVTDIILSLAISFIFLTRRSLLLPILIHALYNLALILYI